MTTLPSLRSSSPTTTRSAPLRSILSALALVVLAASAPAQMPGGGRSGINAAMLKLFGEFSSFSSKAEVRMLDKGAKEPISMMVDFSMLDGQVRMDLDISTLKSTEVSAEILQSFKAAGLDKVTTIIRPHQKSALLIYPVVRGYVDLPMSKEEAADMDRKFTVARTKLGRETVDGQPCDKTQVRLEADNGDKQEAIVWYSPAAKNFPVKMEMTQEQMVVTVQYREVKTTKPDAQRFQVPAGFAKQASVEQLMQSAMLKMLGGGGKAP